MYKINKQPLLEQVALCSPSTFLIYQFCFSGLLQQTQVSPTAPQFQRAVGGIGVVNGSGKSTDNARSLASDYSANVASFDAAQLSQVPEQQTISVEFSDGSTPVTTKAAFLNMLPFDMPVLDGMEPWSEPTNEYSHPSLATKVVMGWNDKLKAPPHMLGSKSCVGGGVCQRFIFSGDNMEDWYVHTLHFDFGPATSH